MANYFDERDAQNIEKIREICDSLPDFVMQFIVSIQMKTTPLTRLEYVRDIKIFLEYLIKSKFKHYKSIEEISISDMNSIKDYDIELFMEHIDSYVKNDKRRKCNDTAKARKLSSLRSFFKYLYRRELIEENITAKIDTPKIHEKPIRFLEINEIADLLDAAESGLELTPQQKVFHKITKLRDVAILSLFLGTGIRISECVGLNRDDFDFSQNAVKITRKGGAQVVLYYSDEVRNALEAYLLWLDAEINNKTDLARKITDNQAFFISLRGGRITVRTVQFLVEKYCKIVSPLKHITPHKLRSTFGTNLYRETQDIYVVADVLGHRDVNTTKKHYAAISDEIRRKAANVVKLRSEDDDK